MHCQVAKQPDKDKVLAGMNAGMETRLALGLRAVEIKGLSAFPETGIALILDSFPHGTQPLLIRRRWENILGTYTYPIGGPTNGSVDTNLVWKLDMRAVAQTLSQAPSKLVWKRSRLTLSSSLSALSLISI